MGLPAPHSRVSYFILSTIAHITLNYYIVLTMFII